MPLPAGSVHAHILTNNHRAGFAVSRSKFVETDAAPCAFPSFAGIQVPLVKRNWVRVTCFVNFYTSIKISQRNGHFCSLKYQFYRASPKCVCWPTLPFGLVSLRHAANGIVRPTVRMGGRRSSAVDAATVVVAGVRTSDVGCVSMIGDADCSPSVNYPEHKLRTAL